MSNDEQNVDDVEILAEAADYLDALGGGPLVDRLRALHERLTA